MTTHHPSPASSSSQMHPSVTPYVYGFLLSVLCTVTAFWLSPFFGHFAVVAIVVLAVAQLLVQLVFFLHLGKRSAPAWHRSLFAFTLTIVAILIGGTLWIMHNLSRLHMHSPSVHDIYEEGMVAPQNELH